MHGPSRARPRSLPQVTPRSGPSASGSACPAEPSTPVRASRSARSSRSPGDSQSMSASGVRSPSRYAAACSSTPPRRRRCASPTTLRSRSSTSSYGPSPAKHATRPAPRAASSSPRTRSSGTGCEAGQHRRERVGEPAVALGDVGEHPRILDRQRDVEHQVRVVAEHGPAARCRGARARARAGATSPRAAAGPTPARAPVPSRATTRRAGGRRRSWPRAGRAGAGSGRLGLRPLDVHDVHKRTDPVRRPGARSHPVEASAGNRATGVTRRERGASVRRVESSPANHGEQ